MVCFSLYFKFTLYSDISKSFYISRLYCNELPRKTCLCNRRDNKKQTEFFTTGKKRIDIIIHVLVGFQNRGCVKSHTKNEDEVNKIQVVSAQCFTGSEKNPADGIKYKFFAEKLSQAYRKTVSFYTNLTKANIFQS